MCGVLRAHKFSSIGYMAVIFQCVGRLSTSGIYMVTVEKGLGIVLINQREINNMEPYHL